MLDAEERMEIQFYRGMGGAFGALPRATGRSRNTVRRYLRGDGDITAKCKPGPRRITKLDPFKDYILEHLQAAAPDKIPAVVLFREIRQRGYRGQSHRGHRIIRPSQ
jgi:transposase